MLLDKTENRLDIVDQNIVVTGNISVDDANLLSETTTGTVTASIATTESITELKTLTETNNAYTIVIIIRCYSNSRRSFSNRWKNHCEN